MTSCKTAAASMHESVYNCNSWCLRSKSLANGNQPAKLYEVIQTTNLKISQALTPCQCNCKNK